MPFGYLQSVLRLYRDQKKSFAELVPTRSVFTWELKLGSEGTVLSYFKNRLNFVSSCRLSFVKGRKKPWKFYFRLEINEKWIPVLDIWNIFFVSDLEKRMSGCSDPGFLGTLTRALLSCMTQIVGNWQKSSSSGIWGKQLSPWPVQMAQQLEYSPTLVFVLSLPGLCCTSPLRTDLMCPLFPDKSISRSASQEAQHLWLTLQTGRQ